MQNAKDIKVLVVEDSQVQINWAKEQLSGYNLTVAENIRDGKKAIHKTDFDIQLVDLELPKENGDEPSAKDGLYFFKNLMHRLLEYPYLTEQFKSRVSYNTFYTPSGLALMSNFEHHITNYKDNSSLYDAKSNLEVSMGLTAKIDEKDGYFVIEKRDNRINNIVLLCDSVSIGKYPNYYKDGESFSNKEVAEKFISGYEFCKAGAVPLKPYKEVAEYLSQFVK